MKKKEKEGKIQFSFRIATAEFMRISAVGDGAGAGHA
jgi:hypothetical protein